NRAVGCYSNPVNLLTGLESYPTSRTHQRPLGIRLRDGCKGGVMESSPGPGGHLLVRAARGEEVERPPVWAMRQAGRWDPEFNRLRAGLPFYEFSEKVELAARASLLPRRFGVDAIILFYYITTLTVATSLQFTLL